VTNDDVEFSKIIKSNESNDFQPYFVIDFSEEIYEIQGNPRVNHIFYDREVREVPRISQ